MNRIDTVEVNPVDQYDQEQRDVAFTNALRDLVKKHTGRDDHFVMCYWRPNHHGHRYAASCDPREIMVLGMWMQTELAAEMMAKMHHGGTILVPDGVRR